MVKAYLVKNSVIYNKKYSAVVEFASPSHGVYRVDITNRYNNFSNYYIFKIFYLGVLRIDDTFLVSGVSPPGATWVNNIEKVYFGGTPTSALVPERIPVRIISNFPLKFPQLR